MKVVALIAKWMDLRPKKELDMTAVFLAVLESSSGWTCAPKRSRS